MIDVSVGLSDSIHKQIDASYYPDGWRRYMARAIKEVFPDFESNPDIICSRY